MINQFWRSFRSIPTKWHLVLLVSGIFLGLFIGFLLSIITS